MLCQSRLQTARETFVRHKKIGISVNFLRFHIHSMHLIEKDEEYEKRPLVIQILCCLEGGQKEWRRDSKGLEGREADNTGGGWGGGGGGVDYEGREEPWRKQEEPWQISWREEPGTGGNRRSQAGPRLQRWWQPTVEPTEGGAMVENELTNPGGPPMPAKQVVVEPEAETERRWARVKGSIQRAKGEQMARATEAQVGIRRAAVEPEKQRTKV